MTTGRAWFGAMAFLGLLCCWAAPVEAQAKYAAYGPGGFVSVGVAAAAYNSDYGQRTLGGGSVYITANPYRRIGAEARVTYLSLNAQDGMKERTYLAGPTLTIRGRHLRPYARLLAGRGQLDFPYGYATGSYFVVAPGGGLDWHIGETKWTVRLIDYEYQRWPGFTFGALHPSGLTTGIAWRVR